MRCSQGARGDENLGFVHDVGRFFFLRAEVRVREDVVEDCGLPGGFAAFGELGLHMEDGFVELLLSVSVNQSTTVTEQARTSCMENKGIIRGITILTSQIGMPRISGSTHPNCFMK